MRTLILTISLILFAWFILLPGIGFLFVTGNVPFTACGKGFGPWHYNSRVEMIQKEFLGEVPNDMDILSFRCMSWQDRFFETDFLLSKNDAEKLIQAMEQTYLNEGPRDNEYPFNTQMASKSKRDWIENKNKYVEYKLPSYGGYYVKEVKVSTPIDSNDMSRVYLTSYTW